MIVIPAIDLRGGACVQLVGGNFAEERVHLDDPIAVAKGWRALGFTRVHVVDLDAAKGSGSNASVIGGLLDAPGVTYQVGGGIRSDADVSHWLARGVQHVVVGTRAVEDPDWLDAQARRWPGRVIVALDVRGGSVQLRGWTADAEEPLTRLLKELRSVPLGGVLVTAVDVEGRMGGPDVHLMKDVRASTTHQLIASGGIATLDDLAQLDTIGINGAVIGMALYTGTLDAATAARRYAA